MLYSWLVTGALALVVFLVVRLLVRRKEDVTDNLPPGPAPWPVIGNLAVLSGDVLNALSTLRKQYGDVYRLYMGNTLVVFLHGEEACKEMLVTKGDDFVDRPKDYIGENVVKGRGIVYTSGPLWKTQRRFALHTLNDLGFGKSSQEGKIQEEVLSLLDWTSHREGGAFSMDKMINTSVTNVLCSIVFGNRYNIDNPEFKGYLEIKDELIETLGFSGAVVFLPWIRYLPGDFFKYHRTLRNYSLLEDFLTAQIQEHRASLDPENPRDFIDVYLNEIARAQGQSTFKDTQLCSVIVEFFIAGSETTSITLIWALLFLINHPDVQTRIRAEIHSVVGKSRLPSVNDRTDLPYLEATIREIQRCADVIPLNVPRAASVNSTLGSYTIPQGTTVIPVFASVHHDPDTFPEPTKFDPGRFLGPNGSVKPGHLLPFSTGKRSCLGESLARMELFLFLSAMLQRFVFLPPEGVTSLPVESTLGVTRIPKPFLLRVRSEL